jgi:hypothetical protein
MKKTPDLVISAEKVAAILAKARQFDVKDVVTIEEFEQPV